MAISARNLAKPLKHLLRQSTKQLFRYAGFLTEAEITLRNLKAGGITAPSGAKRYRASLSIAVRGVDKSIASGGRGTSSD